MAHPASDAPGPSQDPDGATALSRFSDSYGLTGTDMTLESVLSNRMAQSFIVSDVTPLDACHEKYQRFFAEGLLQTGVLKIEGLLRRVGHLSRDFEKDTPETLMLITLATVYIYYIETIRLEGANCDMGRSAEIGRGGTSCRTPPGRKHGGKACEGTIRQAVA
jgi:hypothetical protein